MDNVIENFQPSAFNHERWFLILFCGSLAALIAVNFREQLKYFKTEPARIYGSPPPLLSFFQLPKLNAKQFALFGIGLILSLTLAALNFYPRLFLCAALVCYFPYFNSIMSLAYVQRKTNLIPVILLILLFSPSIAAPLDEPTAVWSIVLIKIVIAQMYFSAGLQKLINSGWKWCDGENMQAILFAHFLWNDREIARLLAQNKRLCQIFSIAALFFELTFWTIILVPPLTFVYVALAILFHFGTLMTMRINYFTYLSPAYLVFFAEIIYRLLNK